MRCAGGPRVPQEQEAVTWAQVDALHLVGALRRNAERYVHVDGYLVDRAVAQAQGPGMTGVDEEGRQQGGVDVVAHGVGDGQLQGVVLEGEVVGVTGDGVRGDQSPGQGELGRLAGRGRGRAQELALHLGRRAERGGAPAPVVEVGEAVAQIACHHVDRFHRRGVLRRGQDFREARTVACHDPSRVPHLRRATYEPGDSPPTRRVRARRPAPPARPSRLLRALARVGLPPGRRRRTAAVCRHRPTDDCVRMAQEPRTSPHTAKRTELR